MKVKWLNIRASFSCPTELYNKDTTNILNIQMLLDFFSHSLMSTANIR